MQEGKQTVLIVDDTPANIDVLGAALRDFYRVKAALSGPQALKILDKSAHEIDLVLLDIMMPGMDGYEVCRAIKAHPVANTIPVIFVTALSDQADEQKGLELGAVDYITKPINPAITLSRIRTHLALSDQNRSLEEQIRQRTGELQKSRLAIIRQLGRAAEFKDNETGLHVIRMSHYARLIAESMVGGANDWTDLIFQAAAMHDVGKIGIPDRILLKQGPLDTDEWDRMMKHPEFGAEIIGDHDSRLLQVAREVALSHHEHWDGSGYPLGLSGEQIPLSGRITAVADVFDALTSERPYKKAWDVEKALAVISESAGTHFDPEVVAHFYKVLPQVAEIHRRFAEDGGA